MFVRFDDLHSGGYPKYKLNVIIIEANDEQDALDILGNSLNLMLMELLVLAVDKIMQYMHMKNLKKQLAMQEKKIIFY